MNINRKTSSQPEINSYLTYMGELSALNQFISFDDLEHGGVPVFRGTQVSVKTLFEFLEYSNLDEFLQEYPMVSYEQAEAIMELVVATDFL